MKKIFSIAMTSLLVMSCASTSKEASETTEPTTSKTNKQNLLQ